jgi:hypothetical protein
MTFHHPITTAPADALAQSIRQLIDEVILVFPEGSDAEEAEVQGRICLRLLEQAQQEAALLALSLMQTTPRAARRRPDMPAASPVTMLQR